MEGIDECKQLAQNLINSVCNIARCQHPENNDEIIDYILQHVKTNCHPIHWSSTDVGKAFIEYLENPNQFHE